MTADTDICTDDGYDNAELFAALQALHSGGRTALRELSTDLLRDALGDADAGLATSDVCEALSEEINRREVAEVMTDWCVTCDYSGIRTPAIVTRDGPVHLCAECDTVYDDIRAENATS